MSNTITIWAHNYLQDRNEEYACAWCVLKEMITEDPSQSTYAFIWLADIIKEDIEKKITNMRTSICYKMRLAITLHFVATGDKYSSIKVAFMVGLSTIFVIIDETCKAICNKLKASKLKVMSSMNSWREVEEGFKTNNGKC